MKKTLIKFEYHRFKAICQYLSDNGVTEVPLYSGDQHHLNYPAYIQEAIIRNIPDEIVTSAPVLLDVDSRNSTFRMRAQHYAVGCIGFKEYPFTMPEENREQFFKEVMDIMEAAALTQAEKEYDARLADDRRRSIEHIKEVQLAVLMDKNKKEKEEK